MAWNHYQNMRRKVGVALRVSDLPDEIVNCAPQDERVWPVDLYVITDVGLAALSTPPTPNEPEESKA